MGGGEERFLVGDEGVVCFCGGCVEPEFDLFVFGVWVAAWHCEVWITLSWRDGVW